MNEALIVPSCFGAKRASAPRDKKCSARLPRTVDYLVSFLSMIFSWNDALLLCSAHLLQPKVLMKMHIGIIASEEEDSYQMTAALRRSYDVPTFGSDIFSPAPSTWKVFFCLFSVHEKNN